MTGKKPRPRTEPMYSGGNIYDYPPANEIKYTHFIASNIRNSENVVISQSFYDEHFSGIFAPSKRYSPRPAVSWAQRPDYHSFLELVKENWTLKNGKSKQIYSLACDEKLGFGVFFMENYGTAQTIVTNTYDVENKFIEGFHITACAARGSTFYIVMTKGTKEYKGQPQAWLTTSTWEGARDKIMEKYREEGKVITGICYSTGLRQYFLVMTTIPELKTWKWFDGVGAARQWMIRNWEYHPTIIFKDPTDRKILVVMTTDVNISSSRCTCKFNVKIC